MTKQDLINKYKKFLSMPDSVFESPIFGYLFTEFISDLEQLDEPKECENISAVNYWFKCSNCNFSTDGIVKNYCTNCGAKIKRDCK